MVSRGEFREDLFYRLNVVPAWMPPLRARQGDIDALARHFCAALGAANGRPDASLDVDALAALREQPWRGNVRQLQNFIERLVVLAPSSRLTRADVDREFARHPAFEAAQRPSTPAVAASTPPPAPSTPPSADGARKTLDEQRRATEREALITALQRANDNRTVAARILGVSRRTLYNKLEEYGLS
jgi:two-component system response regulator AtoC